ncbi:MAG: GDP-mannose 4,6-dehydratase, partial [Bacteroidota bacterium]
MPPSDRRHTPRSVLVTGGAGFIGSNFLLRMVARRSDVYFVNLDALTYAGNLRNLAAIEKAPNYTFVRGDITNPDVVREVVRRHEITTVVHFAAESHVDRSILAPLGFVRTNVDGTAVLLEAVREYWAGRESLTRFVHVSTDEVFGSLG